MRRNEPKLKLDRSMKIAIAVLLAAMLLDGAVQGTHPVAYEETTFGVLQDDDDGSGDGLETVSVAADKLRVMARLLETPCRLRPSCTPWMRPW